MAALNPPRARSTAMPRPIPREAPVIKATWRAMAIADEYYPILAGDARKSCGKLREPARAPGRTPQDRASSAAGQPRPNPSRNSALTWGSGFIWHRIHLEAYVIPAKAGIHCAGRWKCSTDRLD